MKDRAVTYFKSGRGNCAESVAAVFREEKMGNPVQVYALSGCGHGRAPGGMCGALYAGLMIAGEAAADVIEERFRECTGDCINCRDVRRSGTLSCSECVAVVCETLEEELKRKRVAG